MLLLWLRLWLWLWLWLWLRLWLRWRQGLLGMGTGLGLLVWGICLQGYCYRRCICFYALACQLVMPVTQTHSITCLSIGSEATEPCCPYDSNAARHVAILLCEPRVAFYMLTSLPDGSLHCPLSSTTKTPTVCKFVITWVKSSVAEKLDRVNNKDGVRTLDAASSNCVSCALLCCGGDNLELVSPTVGARSKLHIIE